MMNTYFLEFHNWNLHLPIYHLQMFIFVFIWKGRVGRLIVACWKLSVIFFSF